MKVLIIESDLCLCALLKIRIERLFRQKFEFTLDTANSFQSGLNLIYAWPPDITIISTNLPETNYQEIMDCVKMLAETSSVILLTPVLTNEIICDAISHGADEVIECAKLSTQFLYERLLVTFYRRIYRVKRDNLRNSIIMHNILRNRAHC